MLFWELTAAGHFHINASFQPGGGDAAYRRTAPTPQ